MRLETTFRTIGDETIPKSSSDATADAFPKMVGFSNDFSGFLRLSVKAVSFVIGKTFKLAALNADKATKGMEILKEVEENRLTNKLADFSVAEGRLGINNPDSNGTLFSMRHELFRILNNPDSTGTDYMLAPAFGDTGVVRTWNVADQALPLPYNLGATDFNDTGLFGEGIAHP